MSLAPQMEESKAILGTEKVHHLEDQESFIINAYPKVQSANENRATPIMNSESMSDPTLRTEYEERVNNLND